jgi:hypothetical protein
MNLDARYNTADLISLFTQLQNDGYTGLNLKLAVDLIEARLEAPPESNTVARLKEELSQYSDDTPILWQYYTADHAYIDPELWRKISQELQTNTEFLEDHHEFINGWFDSAQKKIEELEEGNEN